MRAVRRSVVLRPPLRLPVLALALLPALPAQAQSQTQASAPDQRSGSPQAGETVDLFDPTPGGIQGIADSPAEAPPDDGSEEPSDPAAGPDADARGTLSITWENDIFGNEDRDYTNGVRVDYVSPKNNLSGLGRFMKRGLTDYGLNPKADWYEFYTLGQNMYTPSDISVKVPPPGERPYAGFLYLGFGMSADQGDRLDTLTFEFGVVGPASLAEQTQTLVHEIIGAQIPQGWDTQLDNEPGVRMIYERKWRFSSDWDVGVLDLAADWAPNLTISLGNVNTSAAIGGIARIGQDLQDDYGPPRVRPALAGPGFFRNEDDFSWYAFAGAEGRYVVRDIFIQGNSFGGVKGVPIEPLVADFQVGVAFQIGRTEISYTQVLRTEQYSGQGQPSVFGSVNLRTRF